MKNLLSIPDSAENRIHYFFLGAFLLTLPYDRFYNQLALIGLIAHTVIHMRKFIPGEIFNRQNLAVCSVLLLNLAGWFYSPDPKQAGEDTGRQTALLLLPLVLSLSRFPFAKYRERLLVLYALGIAAAILYLYADAFRIILYYRMPLKTILSPVFINQDFSSPIGIHATYLALYASLALVILALRIFYEPDRRLNTIYLLAAAILLAGLLQLASKAVLLATAVSGTGLLFYLRKGKKRNILVILFFVLAGILVWGISSVDALRKRYVTELKEDFNGHYRPSELAEPRLLRWKYVWRKIQERPLAGYGSGSEKKLLKEVFYEHRLYRSYLNELNAHSQYLSLWLKFGLAGLLVFAWALGYGFITGWRNRDMALVSFIGLIAVVSFSENLLDVNKGVFFYAFFFTFFLKAGQPFRLNTRLDTK